MEAEDNADGVRADFEDFDDWYEIFYRVVRKDYGYTGPLDKLTFEADYEEGKTPGLAARDFRDVLGT